MLYNAYKQVLSLVEQEEYDVYYRYLVDEQTSFPTSLGPDSINRILLSILNDHPELYWFEGKWKWYRGWIFPEYSGLKEKQNLFHNETRKIMNHLYQVADESSVFQTIASAYDFLLHTVNYDISARNSQNSYGAIVEKKAVCKGISKMFQIIMLDMGIPCTVLKGTIDGMGDHIWNVVFANNSWYHVDVTMGYSRFHFLKDIIGKGDFSYCCLSKKEIRKTHKWQ